MKLATKNEIILEEKKMSRFLKVVCECGENAVVFGDSKLEVKCKKGGLALVEPRGGRARINCRVLEVLT